MVERSYGVAGSGRKWPKNHEFFGGSRWPPPPLSRPDPARPAAVRHEIPPAGSSGCGALSRPARVAGGASSGQISHSSQMNKKPNLVPGLESSFLGFLELKKCLGG